MQLVLVKLAMWQTMQELLGNRSLADLLRHFAQVRRTHADNRLTLNCRQQLALEVCISFILQSKELSGNICAICFHQHLKIYYSAYGLI